MSFRPVTPRAPALAALEYALLCGAWLVFVAKLKPHESALGLAAAALAAVADALVKAQDLGPFSPRWRTLLLALAEPWYALDGTAANLGALARRLAGRPSQARFRDLPLDAAGRDPEAAARRALAVTLLSVPPNSIALAADPEGGRILLHQMRPGPPNALARRLGVGP